MYADYKDKTDQTLANILGSFLFQLLTTAIDPIPDKIIQKLHDTQLRRGKLGAEDNLALLRIRLHQLKRSFICIDAIDELRPKVRRQLLKVVEELGTNNTRFFLTGRGYIESDIQKYLQVMPRYTVIISASELDIQTFVTQQIADDPYSDMMDEVLVKDIVDAIIEKSQGM